VDDSRSDTLSTEDIVAKSQSEACLNWRISGACIWLKCSFFGCRIITTPRVSHRLPDFVVAAYPHPGDSPWPAGSNPHLTDLLQNSGQWAGGNLTGNSTTHLLHDEIKFNEVDVIGGPAAQLLRVNRFLCHSASRPFFPYYLSLRDAIEWRSGSADSVRREAQQAGLREIGSWPQFTWGSVYPRAGFLVQTHAGKAAAVAAQRGIDIVLRDATGHVTEPSLRASQQQVKRGNPSAASAQDCHQSGGRWQHATKLDDHGRCVGQVWQQWLPIENEQTEHWQMLLPYTSQHCETFGSQPEWPHPGIAASGRYLWNYWAHYKCCVKAGGVLLKHFDF